MLLILMACASVYKQMNLLIFRGFFRAFFFNVVKSFLNIVVITVVSLILAVWSFKVHNCWAARGPDDHDCMIFLNGEIVSICPQFFHWLLRNGTKKRIAQVEDVILCYLVTVLIFELVDRLAICFFKVIWRIYFFVIIIMIKHGILNFCKLQKGILPIRRVLTHFV